MILSVDYPIQLQYSAHSYWKRACGSTVAARLEMGFGWRYWRVGV